MTETPETATTPRTWRDIEPRDAVDIDCTKRTDLSPPLNENGEVCPWPWEPQQLKGAPLGQMHCSYCGAMCMAGVQHPDWRDVDFEADLRAEYERHVAEVHGGGECICTVAGPPPKCSTCRDTGKVECPEPDGSGLYDQACPHCDTPYPVTGDPDAADPFTVPAED